MSRTEFPVRAVMVERLDRYFAVFACTMIVEAKPIGLFSDRREANRYARGEAQRLRARALLLGRSS